VTRPLTGTDFRDGDIVVMAVARHFSIGRITGDGGIQAHIASEKDLATALARACQLAAAVHRVFVYRSAGASGFEPYDCRAISSSGDR
jgi:hypothetical protein